MDGAKSWDYFWNIILPHLARPITVVILIQTIFLMNTFAEIKVTQHRRLCRQPHLSRVLAA